MKGILENYWGNMNRNIILLLFIISSVVMVSALDKIYFLQLNYNDGKFNLIDIKVADGFFRGKVFNENLDYKIKIIGYDNSTLWENMLEVSSIIYLSVPEEGNKQDQIVLKNINITEALPYFNEAKYIKVYYRNLEVFSIDVTKYSNYCGNNVCNKGEENTCLIDCKEDTLNFVLGWISANKILSLLVIFAVAIILYLMYKKLI